MTTTEERENATRGSGYANWYSKRNQRMGHLFQGRYKAFLEETALHHEVLPQEYVGFRSLAAGRAITAPLCRRWTGDSIASLSQRFGLSHPDSASNLVRRAKARQEKSQQYRQVIDDIEYNLELKTENLA